MSEESTKRHACQRWLAAIGCMLLSILGDACADSAEPSDSASDAHASSASQADSGIPPELEQLTQRAVAAYDRQMKASCSCFVAAGTYASEKDCLMLLGSGSSWTDCGAKFLAEHDSPEHREQIACFIASTERQADCAETAACDTKLSAMCNEVPAACAQSEPTLVLQLLERCPDLGLLSR